MIPYIIVLATIVSLVGLCYVGNRATIELKIEQFKQYKYNERHHIIDLYPADSSMLVYKAINFMDSTPMETTQDELENEEMTFEDRIVLLNRGKITEAIHGKKFVNIVYDDNLHGIISRKFIPYDITYNEDNEVIYTVLEPEEIPAKPKEFKDTDLINISITDEYFEPFMYISVKSKWNLPRDW